MAGYRWSITGVAVLACGLVSACGSEVGDPHPVPVTVSVAATTVVPDQVRIDRNLRVQRRLVELGCDSNSCIQTYFACMDGYLTGEPCEFYRRNPIR